MTQAEYEALIKTREDIKCRLQAFGWEIDSMLTEMGVPTDGKASLCRVENGMAKVEYLKPGCRSSCCGEEYETMELPAKWIFGEVDWRAEHAALQKSLNATLEQMRLVKEEKERLEQEQRDREEFSRLKAKFEPSEGGLK